MEELILKIPEQFPMTDDELFAFCAANKELRIERDENEQLIIISPAGGLTGNRNFKLTGMFSQWAEKNAHLGYGFDSATGFRLKDKSMRSPDVSWVTKAKWDVLTREEQEKFAPVCPDFVIELKSPSDSLLQLKAKMEKWIENGCQLGWLIDPQAEKVYVYKPNITVSTISGFDNEIKGDDLLPGFKLSLARLR
jgi:Uma2 family endonuclease